MQTRKLATAAIASALLLFGGLSSASALPTGAIKDPSPAAAPSTPEAGAGIVKVRRGFRRGRRGFGRRHFRRRHFRFGIHRGGFRNFYRFRRHRYYGRSYYRSRNRYYSRRCFNCGYGFRRHYRYY